MKEKVRTRALRRHHNERIKAKRRKQEKDFYPWKSNTGYSLVEDEKKVKTREGKLFHTPKSCSCWMCGNPRKYFNQKTFKEINADLKIKEELFDFLN